MTKGELDLHTFEHEQKKKFEKDREDEINRQNAKKWRCDRKTCEKSFLTEKSFQMHMDMHEAEDDRIWLNLIAIFELPEIVFRT